MGLNVSFGKLKLGFAVSILFWFGNVPLIIGSYLFGKYIYLSSFIDKTVKLSNNMYTSEKVNNLPLGIFIGIIAFIAGIILWRIICEFIFIIVKYFKNNTNEK